MLDLFKIQKYMFRINTLKKGKDMVMEEVNEH